MAEAIARGLYAARAADRPPAPPAQKATAGSAPGGTDLYDFRSAGVSAHAGDPYSAETAEAVRLLGFAPPKGRARAIALADVHAARAIYVMTRAHRRALLDLAPEAADRVYLLEPSGHDIADPIGQPQSRYNQVAQTMLAALNERLDELADADADAEHDNKPTPGRGGDSR